MCVPSLLFMFHFYVFGYNFFFTFHLFSTSIFTSSRNLKHLSHVLFLHKWALLLFMLRYRMLCYAPLCCHLLLCFFLSSHQITTYYIILLLFRVLHFYSFFTGFSCAFHFYSVVKKYRVKNFCWASYLISNEPSKLLLAISMAEKKEEKIL